MCIGCKACEVACKEWNALPADGAGPDVDVLELTGQSYDNTGALGASTYRHVAFVEQRVPAARPWTSACRAVDARADATEVRWLMSSDVCKHCTHAACLDVCPTGALIRTEHGTVLVQQDVCNGCGYCIPACPYGVIDQRPGRRPGVQVHDVPRPARRRPDAGLRHRLPDRVDPVRAAGRAARAGRRRGWPMLQERGEPGPGSTGTTRTTASAATARSSCCWTSPRCTGCRRTRW